MSQQWLITADRIDSSDPMCSVYKSYSSETHYFLMEEDIPYLESLGYVVDHIDPDDRVIIQLDALETLSFSYYEFQDNQDVLSDLSVSFSDIRKEELGELDTAQLRMLGLDAYITDTDMEEIAELVSKFDDDDLQQER